jgi:Gpi18-like mannosyltransferase
MQTDETTNSTNKIDPTDPATNTSNKIDVTDSAIDSRNILDDATDDRGTGDTIDDATDDGDITDPALKKIDVTAATTNTSNTTDAADETTDVAINKSAATDAGTALPIEATAEATTVQEASVVPPRQTWRAIGEPWWKATLAVLPTFLVTRFILVLLAYFGGVLFFVPNYWPGKIAFHDIVYDWYHWDAIRFATIATHGYPSLDYAAFFPLFPALAHVFSVVTHRDILESTMFISNIAFLGALIVLYRFVEVEFDRETAKRTALYLSIFPTTFFFFAGYNESLFLFFMLLCFYTLRRGSWWLAGLFGFLATLTRSLGVFLALIFVCEYARQYWPQLQQVWREKQMKQGLRVLIHLPAVLLIPLGLGIFAYALNVHFHDPLAFVHAQISWRQGLSFPLVAPFIAIKDLLTLTPFTFVNPHNIIDLSALVLFAALLVLCFFGPERLDRSQWTLALFGILALVYALLFPGIPSAGGLYDPMPSMQRLVLEIFVGFIILARLGRRPWVHQTYMLFSLPILAFLVLQFITGHWTV